MRQPLLIVKEVAFFFFFFFFFFLLAVSTALNGCPGSDRSGGRCRPTGRCPFGYVCTPDRHCCPCVWGESRGACTFGRCNQTAGLTCELETFVCCPMDMVPQEVLDEPEATLPVEITAPVTTVPEITAPPRITTRSSTTTSTTTTTTTTSTTTAKPARPPPSLLEFLEHLSRKHFTETPPDFAPLIFYNRSYAHCRLREKAAVKSAAKQKPVEFTAVKSAAKQKPAEQTAVKSAATEKPAVLTAVKSEVKQKPAVIHPTYDSDQLSDKEMTDMAQLIAAAGPDTMGLSYDGSPLEVPDPYSDVHLAVTDLTTDVGSGASFEGALGGRNSGVQPSRNSGVQPGRNSGVQPGRNSGVQPGRNSGVQPGRNSGVQPGTHTLGGSEEATLKEEEFEGLTTIVPEEPETLGEDTEDVLDEVEEISGVKDDAIAAMPAFAASESVASLPFTFPPPPPVEQ